jgi:hypothetical protein
MNVRRLRREQREGAVGGVGIQAGIGLRAVVLAVGPDFQVVGALIIHRGRGGADQAAAGRDAVGLFVAGVVDGPGAFERRLDAAQPASGLEAVIVRFAVIGAIVLAVAEAGQRAGAAGVEGAGLVGVRLGVADEIVVSAAAAAVPDAAAAAERAFPGHLAIFRPRAVRSVVGLIDVVGERKGPGRTAGSLLRNIEAEDGEFNERQGRLADAERKIAHRLHPLLTRSLR